MVNRGAMLVLAVAIAACSSTPSVPPPPPQLDLTEKSMVLVSILVTRPDATRYIPRPQRINLALLDTPDGHSRSFGIDRDDSVQFEHHLMYVVRLPLAPGKYRLCSISGSASASPYNADFDISLLRDFTVAPNVATYAGRVVAKLRPRTGNEFRAGPVEPAPDQTITGMAEGTWDVSVDNKYSEDIPFFRAKEPGLGVAAISTTLLPPYDREVIQKFSEIRATNPNFPPCPAPGR